MNAKITSKWRTQFEGLQKATFYFHPYVFKKRVTDNPDDTFTKARFLFNFFETIITFRIDRKFLRHFMRKREPLKIPLSHQAISSLVVAVSMPFADI